MPSAYTINTLYIEELEINIKCLTDVLKRKEEEFQHLYNSKYRIRNIYQQCSNEGDVKLLEILSIVSNSTHKSSDVIVLCSALI